MGSMLNVHMCHLQGSPPTFLRGTAGVCAVDYQKYAISEGNQAECITYCLKVLTQRLHCYFCIYSYHLPQTCLTLYLTCSFKVGICLL